LILKVRACLLFLAPTLLDILQKNNIILSSPYSCFFQTFIEYFLQSITILELDNNRIGLEVITHLANTSQQNTVTWSTPLFFLFNHPFSFFQTISIWVLSKNHIGQFGAKLTDALQHNKVTQLVSSSTDSVIHPSFFTDTLLHSYLHKINTVINLCIIPIVIPHVHQTIKILATTLVSNPN
jgi:hypothetical protein